MMGGDIKITSQVEIGTIVSFNLPIIPLENSAQLLEKNSPRQVISLAPNQPEYRILIVDDQFLNRKLLRELLTPIGFKIEEATNGLEGITIWEKWKPHLIFMDMRMPVMDGYSASKKIKNSPTNEATIVIAVTAGALEEEKTMIQIAGCDDIINKPFREETIFEILSKYLGIKYIYNDEKIATKENLSYTLSAKDLTVMSGEWLAKLYDASINLEDKIIIQLLEEIPDKYVNLKESLKKLVDNFLLEDIIKLIEKIDI